ncbi:MAG: protein translocase subunit SecDF [Lewinellaceae bacterium]|nr:protein translocase subunit SecDF [Lewinellaceae bacterium]
MQSKGIVRFFLIALTLVCLYQYLLIIPTNNVENDAKRYADEMSSKDKTTSWRTHYTEYLDSLSTEPVFTVPLIRKFTYQDLKKSQLGLGLDLKGGMSVLLQVDLQDFLKSLSGNSKDPAFTQSLSKASELLKSQQADYITLFAQAWKESSGGRSLASIFARNESLKGKINFDSSDSDVLQVIRSLANDTVNETYKRLKQRIDKLGVVQPNVNLDAQRDLILVELPGIDNPARARTMLTSSAKLEFWDLYRFGDQNMGQRFVDADNKLKAILSGDSTAVKPAMVKDTIYEYPMGLNGQPDSTKPKEMKVVDRAANQQTAGPLLSSLAMSGQNTPVLGYADKNKKRIITEYLARPEIKSLFPADLDFKWGAKPIEDKGEQGISTLVGKYELFGIKKFRGRDQARLDGSTVTNASEQPDSRTGEVTVSLSMNNEGAKSWAQMTKEAYEGGNREIAIVLDDEVVSYPRVINPIEGGNTSISGSFTIDEARDLASILQVGKLPAGTHIVQESQVGPSLGQDNINKSLMALLLSIGLLCVFMIASYAKGGVVAVIALMANPFFLLGTLASIGTVMTLPGIAGIVLTLAAAVDANVIIYERIREEIRHGLHGAKAISIGFSRALPAIIDANITTLLTAVVLMYFGLGPIKGFGTVLLVGILSSLFTAVLVARLMTDWWAERTEMTYSHNWSANVMTDVKTDWIGKRKYAYMFSGVLILLGFISMGTRGFELGVDFKGGYSFNIDFDKPVDLDGLRNSLTKELDGNPIVKKVSTGNTYNITTSYLIGDTGSDVMDRVIAKLHDGVEKAGYNTSLENFKNTDGQGTHIVYSSQVSATVADDIRASSLKAGLWALALIFLYLLVRFNRWQFSLGAVLALFHDVLITLAFFSFLHGIAPFSLEIDQAIIACILTVIGYSVNDTVIVYDRIREFIQTFAGKPKEEVFNLAINSTLTRTLITSGTVIMVALLLFVFGGSATKGFSFGMLIGMIFGTYSSIFVASSLVVDLTSEKILSGKAVEAEGSKSKTEKAK